MPLFRPSLLLLLAACGYKPGEPVARAPEAVVPGAPNAGVAETFIDFPIGAPLGGYTDRCRCFGGAGQVDDRRGAYVESFASSAGIQTRARAQVLWLDNGQEDLVWVKADLIYAPDALVEELAIRLSAATGRDLEGRVVVSATHSHSAPANWHPGKTWFLGGDRYNQEVFERLTASVEAAALEAFDARQPAAIGFGQKMDWDPDDQIYSDRREENNGTVILEGIPAGHYKDPYLSLLRVDTAAGDPLAVYYSFGMHGTVLGGDNAMVSVEAPGHTELAFEEYFDAPVVVAFVQGGGGDASPRGTDSDYARLESVGALAADSIYELWSETPTSSDPVSLQTVTHAISTSREDNTVTRAGTVDWHYLPYEEDYEPDEVIYNADGSLSSPFDEFNAPFGGAFCGSDLPLIPGASVGSSLYPYSSCIRVDTISAVIEAFFDLGLGTVELPLLESEEALSSATRIGPLPFLNADGTTVTDDVLLGFFPGETTAFYAEQFRRRAKAELGYEHAISVGYSQDHEGYLLIPEDWMMGGYEPNINIWGPLQGEHIMEGVLEMSDRWLSTDLIEPMDPMGIYQSTVYAPVDLIAQSPDTTPTAGSFSDSVPEALFIPPPLGGVLTPGVQPDAVISRIQGIAQVVWEGGDPAVDLPTVTLERQEGTDWVEVTTSAGRPLDDSRPDILTATTPDPLYPFDATQTFTWWAGWQAVSPFHDRAGFPEGTYRLHIRGKAYTGGAATWPWPSADYELTTDPFEVVPAEVSLSVDATTVSAAIEAPAWGYRLVDLDGDSRGANPLTSPQLVWVMEDGTEVVETAAASISGGWSRFEVTAPEGAASVVVTDIYGNVGEQEL